MKNTSTQLKTLIIVLVVVIGIVWMVRYVNDYLRGSSAAEQLVNVTMMPKAGSYPVGQPQTINLILQPQVGRKEISGFKLKFEPIGQLEILKTGAPVNVENPNSTEFTPIIQTQTTAAYVVRSENNYLPKAVRIPVAVRGKTAGTGGLRLRQAKSDVVGSIGEYMYSFGTVEEANFTFTGTSPTATNTPPPGATNTPTPSGPTPTQTPTPLPPTPTRTPTPAGPTPTPTITPTPSPTPTPGPNAANLQFKLRFPDIATAVNSVFEPTGVMVEVRDSSILIERRTVSVARLGNYFRTSANVFFNIPQSKVYTVFVKPRFGIARKFQNVTLAQGTVLDCTVDSNANCGELIAARDSKLLYSGDADGFNTASGSYNKVDSADLQVLVSEFNTLGSGKRADFNFDQKVDVSDLDILGRNYGKQGE